MKKFCGNKDVALLLVRLGVGIIFVVHGWMKLSAITMTIGFFSSINLPGWLAYVVGLIELIGGIALILGVYVSVGASLLALVMVGAIISVKWKMGFLGGYEYDFVLLLSTIGLAFSGAGKFSLWKGKCDCIPSNTENA